jgi:hypothetical protein
MRLEASSGWHQVAQDHVFLEANKVIDLTSQGGFRQHR